MLYPVCQLDFTSIHFTMKRVSMQEKMFLLYAFLNKGKNITEYEGILPVLTHLSPQKASKTLNICRKSRKNVVNRFLKVLHSFEIGPFICGTKPLQIALITCKSLQIRKERFSSLTKKGF